MAVLVVLILAACGGGDDDAEPIDGEVCQVSRGTVDVAVEAWYAQNGEGEHPQSIAELVDEQLVTPNSGFDDAVVVVPGEGDQRSTVIYTEACGGTG